MKILRFLIIGSIFFTGTASAADSFSQEPFTDVPATSAQFEGIEYLRIHNVVKGYLDGTFKPQARINRAEFVQFVVNPFILDTNDMSNCIKGNIADTANSVFYSDVARDAWYATDVCVAKTKQLINGYPDGTFRPAHYINFAEAAKIVSNVFALGIQNQETGEFWYRPYVQKLSDLHAIPVSIKRFNQILTRAEMAEMVYRLKTDRADKASASITGIR